MSTDERSGLHAHPGEEPREAAAQLALKRLEAELIGLAAVKTQLRQILAGLAGEARQAPHMSFTGGPGTGKTTVAVGVAAMLQRLGLLREARVVTVTRDDLVSQYAGHTARKTREALEKASGGVLFIDDADRLRSENHGDDGAREALALLLEGMDSRRDARVVILSGRADRMDQFFRANPALRARIAHRVDFPGYSDAELMAIANAMLIAQNHRFSLRGAEAFAAYIAARRSEPTFAGARSIRNALDRARRRHANRYFQQDSDVRIDGLMTIDAEDLQESAT